MSSDFLNVRRVSYSIARYMANFQRIKHGQRYLYYYSLQIIIGSIFEMGFILTAAWFLGIFYQTALSILVLTSIRFFAGGYHADTYFKCFTITTILLLGVAAIGTFIFNYYSIKIHFLTFITSLFLICKYAPCDTINKPITSESLQKKLRLKSIVLNIFWFAIATYLLFIYKSSNSAAIIGIASLIEAITLTPWIADKAPLNQKNVQNAH